MRKTFFKEKISKYGSLLSLIVITTALALFSLALPGFLVSSSGRIFAVIWAAMAILVFIAHIHRVTPEKRRDLTPYFAGHKKDIRLLKQERRLMRG